MSDMQFSAAARDKLTEPWEECVLYVYDDKQPKRRIDGKLQYPEWDGGPIRGTLTIGFGHTDAAGAPKITKGMRITREEADEILSNDLAPCVRRVNALLDVPVTQHQFDAVVDGEFNCHSMTPKLADLINAGHPEKVPAKMLQYTYSKGEHMDGLTHRRAAEIQWFNTPDDIAPPPAPVEVPDCPKGERNPAPKTMGSSKTGAAATTVFSGGLLAFVRAFNEAMAPLKEARDNVTDTAASFNGSAIVAALHSPVTIAAIGLGVAALAAFVFFDRRRKLLNDHV